MKKISVKTSHPYEVLIESIRPTIDEADTTQDIAYKFKRALFVYFGVVINWITAWRCLNLVFFSQNELATKRTIGQIGA